MYRCELTYSEQPGLSALKNDTTMIWAILHISMNKTRGFHGFLIIIMSRFWFLATCFLLKGQFWSNPKCCTFAAESSIWSNSNWRNQAWWTEVEAGATSTECDFSVSMDCLSRKLAVASWATLASARGGAGLSPTQWFFTWLSPPSFPP